MSISETSEIVERVARRLYAKDWEAQTGNLRDGHFPYEDDDVQEYWRNQAREAITAMREPTGAMLKATGTCSVGYEASVDGYLDDWDAEGVWHAMIDAALKAGG